MYQQSLFDRPLARKSDPQTSHQAAADIVPKLGDLHAWVLGIVRDQPGLTANELAQFVGVGDVRKINRRLPELLEMGKLRRGEARRCSVSGKSCHVWFVVE